MNRKWGLSLFFALGCIAFVCQGGSSKNLPASVETDPALQRFQQMKFGMFIHWGLYAVPAGEWKGKEVPGIGEWIMNREKIPVSEYEPLAATFNPVEFNANEWADLAKDAGMKYMVITAKHHDGFAMYGSKASTYNIVDATPYGKDPMTALSAACAERDLKFGFYYSQAHDWHEPNAFGNTWDFSGKRDPEIYIQNKVLPQVEELLEGYGDLSMIWFDTPRLMNKDQVIELRNLVKEKQPSCLVNSRIGHDQGDYDQTEDNTIPTQVYTSNVWEVPATLNRTWGYKKNDHNWKSPKDLICKLVDIVSKGGNYLLNVGPDATGVIPEDSQRILREVGRWMAVNGESIYDTSHSPFNINGITWRCTAKPGKLYLHILNWPGESLDLDGLSSRVKTARFLDGGPSIQFNQTKKRLSLVLPQTAPDQINTVIVLDIEDEQAVVIPDFGYETIPAVWNLYAWEARLRGPDLVYDWETQSVDNFILAHNLNQLSWINLPNEEGEYLVDIEYACENDKAGSRYVVSSRRSEWDNQNTETSELIRVVEGTDGKFVTKRLGSVKVFSPNCAIHFALQKDLTSESVKVRKLVLTRVE
ncbi:alpha-L-fucosidase [Pontiella sulfatireligans]|uniref:alpha-L-fucosidase n=1 Tax=Pontiella sulfatireligans TaxID=2750658 RepID=A0A6C2UIG3_9BACT|nr:alpha-L-fucosidase [Pontiella sulfatireligans]VGO19114.1 hypothetical protein SCARR_01170 [Pontiella sulfatireligans]